jgi:hypothetical protein
MGKGGGKMVLWVAFVIFMSAIAFWWYLAARQKRRKAVLRVRRPIRSDYHCVEIRSGRAACEAARKLGKTRFLSREAPVLPLQGCNTPNCTCSYAHFDDRREHDRRNPYGEWASIPPALTGERRSRTERRKSSENMFRPSIAR